MCWDHHTGFIFIAPQPESQSSDGARGAKSAVKPLPSRPGDWLLVSHQQSDLRLLSSVKIKGQPPEITFGSLFSERYCACLFFNGEKSTQAWCQLISRAWAQTNLLLHPSSSNTAMLHAGNAREIKPWPLCLQTGIKLPLGSFGSTCQANSLHVGF